MSKWQDIARRVHHELEDLTDTKAALKKEIPGFVITPDKAAEIRAIHPWLHGCLGDETMEDKDMDIIRQGPDALKPLKTASGKKYQDKWAAINDLSLYESEPLVQAFNKAPPPRLREHPCL